MMMKNQSFLLYNKCLLWKFKGDNMIKAAIMGSTGYTGYELARLLLRHSGVDIKILGSRNYAGKKFSSIYPSLLGLCDIKCLDISMQEAAQEVDVIFCATPHGYLAKNLESSTLDKVKIIDLSADFRFSNLNTYKEWYKLTHLSPHLSSRAVYGLCEVHREKIKRADLIANPGCYSTCSILSLYPLVRECAIDIDSIIIDAKSGVSGAGRHASVDNLFCEVNDSFKAYGINSHRHRPEIESQLSLFSNKEIELSFTPHLVPMSRGILTTIYARVNLDKEKITQIYSDYYTHERFIRLLPPLVFPQTRWVKNSNFADISFSIDERMGRIIIVSAIDNLIKGASGQAVMNMNIAFGFKESDGLI